MVIFICNRICTRVKLKLQQN